MLASRLLDFWFGRSVEDPDELAARVPRWFGSDAGLDREIRERFADLPERALAGGLDDWREDPRQCVALILALDQLPRNLYRGEAKAFGFDARALEIALAWIEAGHDERVPPLLSAFGYLPLEHAEDLAMQRRCVSLFAALATRVGRVEPAQREQFHGFASYADRHLAVVERFGRFPHRNALLGRESTQEERAWLDSDGETFGG